MHRYYRAVGDIESLRHGTTHAQFHPRDRTLPFVRMRVRKEEELLGDPPDSPVPLWLRKTPGFVQPFMVIVEGPTITETNAREGIAQALSFHFRRPVPVEEVEIEDFSTGKEEAPPAGGA